MELEQGDAFEQKHIDWIRSKLPSYEPVWSAFIGHDGCGNPCRMPDLSPEQTTKRKTFYQAHYSFVVKMIQIWSVAEEFDSNLGQVTDATREGATECLFNLMAAVGYVRDMFKRNQNGARIGQALDGLQGRGHARFQNEATDGRPTERWYAI